MNCIIVDDEEMSRNAMKHLVSQVDFLNLIAVCSNAMEALSIINNNKIDLLLLDIEMPEMSGLTLAEKLLEKLPSMRVVFITGWNQYAVQAFDINALDYIMKPIRRERFNTMVERIRTEIYEKTMQKPQNKWAAQNGCIHNRVNGNY